MSCIPPAKASYYVPLPFIVNNTEEGVVIELGGGRNGLIEGNTISKAAVAAAREQR